MRTFLPILFVPALAACQQPPSAPMPEQPAMMAVTPVNFMADDGLTVSGRYYRADAPRALILLFHQANSSKDEYATIAHKLTELGYSALAVDQRSGGTMFGPNLTAARMTTPVVYGDALHDLDAALTWGRTMQLPVIVWGSSYSSALVFELAAKHPGEITALLAFSPGEYLGPGEPVARAAARTKVPVFVAVSGDPSELAAARPIFAQAATTNKTFYTPKNGVHGSSTLIDARNPKGAKANWAAVEAFLASVAR